MKCPKCAQDLVDEQDCQSCQRQAPAATTPGDLNEQGAEQTSSPSSPPPNPGDAPPQTAGSNPQTPGTPAPAGENNSELGQAVSGPSASVSNDGTVIAGRDVNFVAILKSALDRADESHKIEKEKSLYEFIKKLPRRPARQYQPPPEELARLVAAWRDRRLILISSAYIEYALDAAWEVIERLPGSPARFNGIIAFEDIASKNIEFSIQKLFDQLPEAKAERVVIVNATHTQAQTFPNSFLGDTALAGTREDVLRDSKHFLVVLVDLSYAHENHLAHQSFPYWEIPFLEPFLKGVFPQEHERLLKEIRNQRGKWEKDEVSFSRQVINYQNSQRLREVIESGGPQDPEGCAEALLKAANPVEKTVLYAATVFEEITSPEFCRVIEALLNERARRAAEQSSPAVVGNGSAGSAHAGETEIPLRRIWEDEKDDIFDRLLVEGTATSDSPRTVNLAESNLREPLRKQFERRHRFYLMDQFNALQETGILFYPSLRVAEHTTQIAMDMARIYPDEFGESWIVSLVMRLKRHFTGALSDESDEDDQMFKFLPSSQPGASDVAFARISDICKRLLASPPQSKVVPNSLDYLLQTGCHEEVLWLIKQLKFSAEFDDWHWLKQLLNRGDAKTKYLTYHYIISYLKRMGANVYDGLTKIETWLPSSERKTYSEFDTFVFRVMIKYCFDTIARFDHRHYGQWPSRYPLFAIANAQLAESHTSLLVNWLLHPAVDRTLADLGIGGSRMTLVGALLAEWSFILLGPADLSQADSSSAESEPEVTTESAESENSAVNWSATDLFNLLLRQFITQIDLSQRVEILSYWNQLEHELFRFRVLPSHGSELRNELIWKRKLVRRLTTEIKKIPPPKKSWPMKATPATAAPADQA